jgi:hemerythrin
MRFIIIINKAGLLWGEFAMGKAALQQKKHLIDEHHRLAEMLDSIMFFIQNIRESAIGPDAIDVLYDRMQAHFGVEEQIARQYDEASARLLHEAHGELLAKILEVKICQNRGDDAEGKRLLTAFAKALELHDETVDIPLFRKLGHQGWV